MTELFPTKADIEATALRIQPYIHRTPVMHSQLVDEKAGAELFFKCENFQKMGAFKMRGATNAILKLSEEARTKGVSTHSSGNFAQAVALAARLMNIKATIVMPSNAPAVKKAAVIGYGADVIDCEPTLAAREGTLADFVAQSGATPLHPYDDWDVICGQGTAAMELLEEVPNLDIVMTPVGGGGLLAGSALAVQHFGSNQRVIGAEPCGADDAARSFAGKKWVPQENPQTIADGLRTSLGKCGFAVMLAHVEEIFTVEEQEIVAAMKFVWERMKIIIEPSSAVPVAAVLKHPEQFRGKRIGIVVSGGNVDLTALPF